MPNRANKLRPQVQPVDLDRPVNTKPLTRDQSERMDHATLSKRPAAKGTYPGPKEPDTRRTKSEKSQKEKNVQKYSH